EPVRPDGHLRPEWIAGGWAASLDRSAVWAQLAHDSRRRQLERIEALVTSDPQRVRSTAHAESAAELLCAELSHDGLPIDVDEAVRIIADAVGERPRSDAEASERQRTRDVEV